MLYIIFIFRATKESFSRLCVSTERRLQHPSVVIQHPYGRFFKAFYSHAITRNFPLLKNVNKFQLKMSRQNQTLSALHF